MKLSDDNEEFQQSNFKNSKGMFNKITFRDMLKD